MLTAGGKCHKVTEQALADVLRKEVTELSKHVANVRPGGPGTIQAEEAEEGKEVVAEVRVVTLDELETAKVQDEVAQGCQDWAESHVSTSLSGPHVKPCPMWS